MGQTPELRTPDDRTRPRGTWAFIGAGYLVMLVAIWLGLRTARDSALSQLASPEAQAQWQAWRKDVEAQRDPQSNTVQRRVPKSTEPPGLVLMRDHFLTCLTGAVIFCSLLYAVFFWFLIGIGASSA